MSKTINDEENGYTVKLVMEEASRCLLCLDAPCSISCPAGTDPGKFIRSVRFSNFKGAAETIRINNSLGGVCARVCPTERYCQQACARCGIDRPIDIGKIQRFVTDFEDACKMEILEKKESNGKRIAIIGSGPSALQAASSLLQEGFDVTIYEKEANLGGALRYAIPEYRLPEDIVDKEISKIIKLGLNYHTNCEVGEAVSLEQLKKDNDAVIICIGSSYGKVLPLFFESKICETAVDFLKSVKVNKLTALDYKNVLVIGGGDVAMDVSTSLKRLGVKNVTDVVYEEFSEFKASKKELEQAQKENVTIIDGYIPTKIEGNKVFFKHRFIPSEISIETEHIILAVGQYCNVYNVDQNININKLNEIEGVDESFHYKDNVFVSGDIATGDKTVVWAVRKGKAVAYAIKQYLEGK